MYSNWTYRWDKGSAYPRVTIYNAANVAVVWFRGVRARTLLSRLRAGAPLSAAVAGLL